MTDQLIDCKLCTGKVSPNAASCPHCGEPIGASFKEVIKENRSLKPVEENIESNISGKTQKESAKIRKTYLGMGIGVWITLFVIMGLITIGILSEMSDIEEEIRRNETINSVAPMDLSGINKSYPD